ncbi:myeloid leukemia factor isoform X2 [Uranotaenia lowii]|uniref:myeloid leukemia factor isoform X2 n=1 Tax=Uranotaenia lowii TaxID=190385 RepID=UPI00247A5475|nr:myeloid leukemia factor isoform X2 [Uranotaenia lowii]
MSLFGMMGDLEDDPIFGHHMRSMRQMNNMMNSLFADPFGMFDSMGGAGGMHRGGNALMPFMGGGLNNMNAISSVNSMNNMNGMNRLLNGNPQGSMFCSSSVISMSSGPNGPQVYQATSSTRTGPGGIKETRRTVQDSRSGTKKMAIGHHIGERAHIIEREQNVRTGTQEERQDFINLADDEAEDFDREFHSMARSAITYPGSRRSGPQILELTDSPSNSHSPGSPKHHRSEPQIVELPPDDPPKVRSGRGSPPGKGKSKSLMNTSGRRSGPEITELPNVHPHPYGMANRKNRSIKGPSSSPYHQ